MLQVAVDGWPWVSPNSVRIIESGPTDAILRAPAHG
jgi:hypothetical protein